MFDGLTADEHLGDPTAELNRRSGFVCEISDRDEAQHLMRCLINGQMKVKGFNDLSARDRDLYRRLERV